MKTIIACLVIGILISCSHSNKIDSIRDNKTVRKIFNEREIQELVKILDFFENQICSIDGGSSSNVLSCYRNFFIRMDSAEVTGDIDPLIDFEQQKNLYAIISDSTFDSIWQFNKTWNMSSPSDTLKSITFNDQGSYFAFLIELAREEKLAKNYVEAFEAAGQMSPGSISHLLKMYNMYNIKDERIRLMIAIHYLTLNDGFKRNEKF